MLRTTETLRLLSLLYGTSVEGGSLLYSDVHPPDGTVYDGEST